MRRIRMTCMPPGGGVGDAGGVPRRDASVPADAQQVPLRVQPARLLACSAGRAPAAAVSPAGAAQARAAVAARGLPRLR